MRIHSWLFCLLWVLVQLPSLLSADSLRLKSPEGVAQFEGVVVEGIKHQGGQAYFFIRLTPADEPHEVEAERIEELVFQEGSIPGRIFDLTFAGLPGKQQVFIGSNVLSFSNMTLNAIPPGMQEPQAVNIKLISIMAPGVRPIPTPVPMPRPVEDEVIMGDDFSFTEESIVVVQDTTSAETPPETGEQSRTGEPVFVEEISASDFDTRPEFTTAQKGLLAGLGVLLIFIFIFAIIVGIMNLIVCIWMFIDACKNGEWIYVGCMIFFCGFASVVYLLFRYDGPAAKPLKIIYLVAYVPLLILYLIAYLFE